jgi:hypothetical protein
LTVPENLYIPLPRLDTVPDVWAPAVFWVRGLVELQSRPDETPARKSPGSVMLILTVTWAPALAVVGVEGSTAPDTSARVMEALAVAPDATEIPVALPLRRTAGNVPPLVNAMTLIRYGPPDGTPKERVLEPAPEGTSLLDQSTPEIVPPSTAATKCVAEAGMFPTERLSCWAAAMKGTNSIRPNS